MDFKKFIKKYAKDIVNEEIDNSMGAMDNSVETDIGLNRMSEDKRLFMSIDPDTGFKYNIPMLTRTAPDYYFKYIYFMKIRESSPSTFAAIMSWE